MLKMCKEEYDRLIETSPKIEQPIIDKFKKTFKKTPYYDKIRKPEICDDLISTELFRFIPDKTVKNTKSMIFDAKKTKILIEKQNEINRVIISFEENQSRYPLLDELIDQVNFSSEEMITLELEDDKDISEFILQILTQYETNKKDLNIDIEMGTKILSETKID